MHWGFATPEPDVITDNFLFTLTTNCLATMPYCACQRPNMEASGKLAVLSLSSAAATQPVTCPLHNILSLTGLQADLNAKLKKNHKKSVALSNVLQSQNKAEFLECKKEGGNSPRSTFFLIAQPVEPVVVAPRWFAPCCHRRAVLGDSSPSGN